MKNYYVYAGKEFGRGDLKGMYGYEAAKVRMSQTDRLCKNCVCVCVYSRQFGSQQTVPSKDEHYDQMCILDSLCRWQ